MRRGNKLWSLQEQKKVTPKIGLKNGPEVYFQTIEYSSLYIIRLDPSCPISLFYVR